MAPITDEEIEVLRASLGSLRRRARVEFIGIGLAATRLLEAVLADRFDEGQVLKAARLMHDLSKRIWGKAS